jgi:hypothetical protein
MPTEEHDSWLGALGVDLDKARDWAKQKVDEVKDDVNKAEDWAKDEVKKGVDFVKTEANAAVDEVKKGVDYVKKEAGKAVDEVKKDAAALKQKAVGDQSGRPVPRPMESDCKPEHGYVPGPKNHLLCATHGHVLDTDRQMIIANSVAAYVTQGAGGAAAANAAGASLPKPSYVAGTPKDSLQGGGTASAGDSTFVTGDQKGTLLQKATAIRSAAKGLFDAEAAIESQGKGDKSAIETAKNLKGIADSMLQVANGLDSVKGSENADALGAAGKASKFGDGLINAADAIIKINDANGQLKAFQDNPSKETAEAWARSVGDLFSGLANYVPDVEPKFISDYWRGLLSAPANYINAFITMQNVYYGNIDKEAGLSKSTGLGGVAFIGHAATKRVSDGSWEGDLTDIYYPGYFLPKLADGTTFAGFMIAHRKTEGMDLWDTDIKVGKAALLTAISRDVPADDPAKSAWMAHVGKF